MAAPPVFIFAVESIFAAELIETLHRLGRGIAGTAITGEPEWAISGLTPLSASELPAEMLASPVAVPWVTPGLKWQKVTEARKLGFTEFPALTDPSAIIA